jgi:serine protease AprX
MVASAALGLPAQSQEHVPGAFWLVHKADLVTQTELLAKLRTSVLAGDRPSAEAAWHALETWAEREQAPLRAALPAEGICVRFTFCLTNALTVQVPPHVGVEALRKLPTVLDVLPVAASRPHVKLMTSDTFSNVDHVQQDPRFTGRGGAIAIIDSGVALLIPGTGQPHRVFRRRGTTGHRLLGTFGVAPMGQTPPPPDDYDGHGTAVSCIAAGVDWGAPPYSDHGYAFDADIVSYRVIDQTGLAAEDAITAAVQRVAADRLRFELRVANISLAGQPNHNHPQQIAMDAVSYYADVLFVTSSGNDGFYPHPTARSHSNCNGLAVGAVWNEEHHVDLQSTFGPLLYDGERFWPDLLALGSGITAKHDDEFVWRINVGTSFSAPQVAGTAVLLRAADPTLTAYATKALILHGVEDIAAVNPEHGRMRYGLGMLRSDLAVAALQHDRLLRGELRAGSVSEVNYTFNLVAGRRYAATLCFPRTGAGIHPDWDNLDLYVFGPDGRLRAASETARNVYEKVVFDARLSGTHRVQVLGRSFTTPPAQAVPFALVFGDDRSGAVQAGSWLSLGPGCAGRGPNGARGVITPPIAATGWGNDNTRVPFSELPVRMQQVIQHDWMPPPAIPFDMRHIAFRRDNNEAYTPNARVDLDLDLGFTSFQAAQMVLSFPGNANLGPMTRVRSGWIDFPGANRRSELTSWDYVIGLDAPFHVNTAPGRNLLLDVTVRSNNHGNQPYDVWFDSVYDPNVGRVYQLNGRFTVFEPTALITSLMGDTWPAVPMIDPVGDARPGQSMRLVVRHALPNVPALFVQGLSRTSFYGLPLPLDLAPWGAPSCFLYTDWFAQLPVFIDRAGQSWVDMTFPPSASLSGTVFHTQLLVPDAGANAFGLVVSGGGRVVVGG